MFIIINFFNTCIWNGGIHYIFNLIVMLSYSMVDEVEKSAHEYDHWGLSPKAIVSGLSFCEVVYIFFLLNFIYFAYTDRIGWLLVIQFVIFFLEKGGTYIVYGHINEVVLDDIWLVLHGLCVWEESVSRLGDVLNVSPRYIIVTVWSCICI